MLRLDVGGGSTEPVLTLERFIAIGKSLGRFILGWRVGVELPGRELRLALSDLDVIIGGLVACVGDYAVDIAGSAAVDIILAGDEARVARQILLVVRVFLRHFCFSYN